MAGSPDPFGHSSLNASAASYVAARHDGKAQRVRFPRSGATPESRSVAPIHGERLPHTRAQARVNSAPSKKIWAE
jgi:hypothetical protein